MEVFRFILIIIVVIIFAIVIYNLLKERSSILKEKEQRNIEGMTMFDRVDDIFSSTVKMSIEDAKLAKLLSVKDYCIKGSYNSAYNGSKISSDALKYVLSRGCRIIDLQIHYSFADGIPYVGNIVDPKGVDMESENRISLYNIFTTILINAFTPTQGNDGCPNPKDPLIIHMRVIPDKLDNRSIEDMTPAQRSIANKSCLVYESIAKCIKQVFPQDKRLLMSNGKALQLFDPFDSKKINFFNLVPTNSNENTMVANRISQKVIFLMDTRNNREYKYNSQTFYDMINGETGGTTIQIYEYGKYPAKKPPLIKDNGFQTNITDEKIVIPDLLGEIKEPNIIDMVIDSGVQVTLYPFYLKKKEELNRYEALFNHYNSAIIPMAYAIRYLDELKTYFNNKRLQLGPF